MGGDGPGGVCVVRGGVPGPRGAWSRGVPGGDPPAEPLLRAVRILLESILVYYCYLVKLSLKLHENVKNMGSGTVAGDTP